MSFAEIPGKRRLSVAEQWKIIADHQRAGIKSGKQPVAVDGLIETVRYDRANRPVHEFSNSGARKVWMDQFTSQPMRQIRISKQPTAESNARFLALWMDDFANGRI